MRAPRPTISFVSRSKILPFPPSFRMVGSASILFPGEDRIHCVPTAPQPVTIPTFRMFVSSHRTPTPFTVVLRSRSGGRAPVGSGTRCSIPGRGPRTRFPGLPREMRGGVLPLLWTRMIGNAIGGSLPSMRDTILFSISTTPYRCISTRKPCGLCWAAGK